jgi:hypothetical protein
MKMWKLVLVAVVPVALLGCPDKNDAKPDPATAASSAKAPAPSASAAKQPSTGGGSGW